MAEISCFKAYDIRGCIPEEFNEDLAYRIGYAYSQFFKPEKIVVGYDIRLESPILAKAVISGLNNAGTSVVDIGLCGTEEVYFQTFHRYSQGIKGGIMITASHNPKGYNGMKLVREHSKPISGENGLMDILNYIKSYPETLQLPISSHPGDTIIDVNKAEYITHLLGYINTNILKPLKIVINPGNSAAGLIVKLLQQHLPFEFIYIQDEPDGNFPNGVPNPLLPENRFTTANTVKMHGADLGIAWDGDFDRCFFFDGNGNFIEGYYIVGLLAEAFIKKSPNEKIIHDPRLCWNTIDIVKSLGGVAVQSKTGHAFIKERMRTEDAIYGGEMSAHHYFRDFAYCDSGMIPWLLIAELISSRNLSLTELVTERMRRYPCSGEINYRVHDKEKLFANILEYFMKFQPHIDYTDGLSLEFSDWRFNIRGSNTESLIRLNIETRENRDLITKYQQVIEQIITDNN